MESNAEELNEAEGDNFWSAPEGESSLYDRTADHMQMLAILGADVCSSAAAKENYNVEAKEEADVGSKDDDTINNVEEKEEGAERADDKEDNKEPAAAGKLEMASFVKLNFSKFLKPIKGMIVKELHFRLLEYSNGKDSTVISISTGDILMSDDSSVRLLVIGWGLVNEPTSKLFYSGTYVRDHLPSPSSSRNHMHL